MIRDKFQKVSIITRDSVIHKNRKCAVIMDFILFSSKMIQILQEYLHFFVNQIGETCIKE